jgi:hypothetical protein
MHRRNSLRFLGKCIVAHIPTEIKIPSIGQPEDEMTCTEEPSLESESESVQNTKGPPDTFP